MNKNVLVSFGKQLATLDYPEPIKNENNHVRDVFQKFFKIPQIKQNDMLINFLTYGGEISLENFVTTFGIDVAKELADNDVFQIKDNKIISQKYSLVRVDNHYLFIGNAWFTSVSGEFKNEVPFFGSASIALAKHIANEIEPCEKGLDVFTGSGIHGIALREKCKDVICVDVDDEAIRMAKINALLNYSNNIEITKGNLFSGVQGQKFDYISGNPPFEDVPPKFKNNYYTFGYPGEPEFNLTDQMFHGARDILKKDGRLFAITIGMIGEDSNTIKTSVQKHLKSFDTKIHYVSETPIDEYCKAKVDLMVRGGKVKNFDETFACFKEHYKKYDKVRGVIVDAKNTGETKISTIGE